MKLRNNYTLRVSNEKELRSTLKTWVFPFQKTTHHRMHSSKSTDCDIITSSACSRRAAVASVCRCANVYDRK